MKILLIILIVVAVVAGGFVYKDNHMTKASVQVTTTKPQKAVVANPKVVATNYCAGNALSHFILVSISQRHMWDCELDKQVYDSSVITGMEFLPADLTPTGTYKIYSKQTNLHLRGSDSTGSWDDPVSYWLPFLSNKYGIYGFHDATWRADSDFGNISPDSKQASHGCVELPLNAAKWLYGWSSIGTTLTIQS